MRILYKLSIKNLFLPKNRIFNFAVGSFRDKYTQDHSFDNKKNNSRQNILWIKIFFKPGNCFFDFNFFFYGRGGCRKYYSNSITFKIGYPTLSQLSIESFRLCSSFYSMNTFYDSKIYSIKYYKRNITKIFFIPADSGKNYFIATIFLCVLYYSYFISFFCQKYNWCNNYFNGKKLMNNIFISLRNKNKRFYNFFIQNYKFQIFVFSFNQAQ